MSDIDSLKTAANGRWTEILSAVAGIDPALLDGKHHPCPKCGGTDRFRLIDEAAGAVLCNQCFKNGNGDGLAAVMWAAGCDFKEAYDRIEKHLHLHAVTPNVGPKVVASFDYRDEGGTLLYRIERWEPGAKGQRKEFKARGPGGKASAKGIRRVLYRLPQLVNADPSELVFIPEGEKHCDALAALGLIATCNAFGAGKWNDEYSESLRGRSVVILPDNDEPGREHAEQVAESLAGIAASIKQIALPGLPPKGDCLDWLAAGGTRDELLRLTTEPTPIPATAAKQPEVEIPQPAGESLLRIPGFVNEVMDFCLATAPYPNVALAFCGAICLQAFLAARKIRDAADNRTNIYCLGLANSAAGKDWPRKLNTRIIHEIGRISSLGDRFASAEGIQDALLVTPSMLFQTDEISGLMQAIKLGHDARFIAINDVLLSLYTTANSIWQVRRKASQGKIERNKKDGKKTEPVDLSINQPSLVMFGTSIPSHYYASMSEAMITNGLLGRMLIVEAGRRAEGQEPKIAQIPDGVLEAAMWWEEMQSGDGNAYELNPEPLIIEATPEAASALVEIRQANDVHWRRREESADNIGMALWGRATEYVRKLALLYAASEDYREPRISLSGVRWAQELIDRQTQRMVYMSKLHLVSNPFHALLQKVKRLLADAPDRTLPKSVILKKLNVDRQTCDKVLDTLVESGDVLQLKGESSGGRPPDLYKLIVRND